MKAKNKKDNLKKIYSDLYVSTKIQTEDNKYKLICYHFGPNFEPKYNWLYFKKSSKKDKIKLSADNHKWIFNDLYNYVKNKLNFKAIQHNEFSDLADLNSIPSEDYKSIYNLLNLAIDLGWNKNNI